MRTVSKPTESTFGETRGFLVVVGILILTTGLLRTHGSFHPDWIWTLPISFLIWLLAVSVDFRFSKGFLQKAKFLIFLLPAVGFLLDFLFLRPNMVVPANFQYYEPSRGFLIPWMEICYGLCAALSVSCLWAENSGRQRAAEILFQATLLVFSVSLLLGLFLAARPWIDVWTVQEDAAAALLRGLDPYSVEYGNIYPKRLQDAFTPYGILFVYMPGVIYLMAPFKALLMDTRVALVLAHALSALLLKESAKNIGGPFGRYFPALLFLAIPFAPFVIQMSWNDTFTCTFAMLFLYSMAKPNKYFFYAAIVGLVLIKAHIYVCLPLMIWYGCQRLKLPFWKTAISMAWISLLFCLPFLVWNWRSFLGSQHGLHFLLGHGGNAFPQRRDSFGLLFFMEEAWGLVVPYLIFYVLALSAALSAWLIKKRPSLVNALGCSALVLTAMFMFAPTAFLNYYWVILCLMIATLTAPQKI